MDNFYNFFFGGGELVHIIFLNDRLLKWDKIILSHMFRWFQAMGSNLIYLVLQTLISKKHVENEENEVDIVFLRYAVSAIIWFIFQNI